MFRLILMLSFLAAPMSLAAQTALQMPPKQAAAAPPYPALPHSTFDRIHAQNAVACGVSKEEEDYSRSTDHGNRAAFDIDLCKAVAVATLGPGAHLVIKSFPDEPSALKALRSGEVDLVATASLSAGSMAQDIAFSAPVLLDGQGFLIAKNAGAHSGLDLAGKRICFLTGSVAEEGLHAYATAHEISYVWYPFSEAGEMEAAFFTGNCDAITSDLTQLANTKAIDPRRAPEFTILPETIREDPLAVAVWAGDPRFAAVVYWTVEVLLHAEKLGVTRSEAAESSRNSRSPEVEQLLGQRFGPGATLGLDPRWGAAVIAAVGNYGELYDRDLGANSSLRLDRGENRLTPQGGALLPLPVRSH